MALDIPQPMFDPRFLEQYRALMEPPPEARKQAGMDSLLALGLGLLANRSPYLGQAVGNAGFAAMGTYRDRMDAARQNRMGEITGAMSLRKLQKDLESEQKLKVLADQYVSGLPQADQSRAMLMIEANPKAFTEAMASGMFPKPTDWQREIQGAGLTPEQEQQARLQRFGLAPKPELPSLESGFLVDRARGTATPLPEMQGFMLQRAATGAPRTMVDARRFEETEEAKAVGKLQGETFGRLQTSGLDAYGKVAKYQRLEQLLQGIETGKLTPAMTEVAALADSVGIKIDPALGAKQAADAITKEMALELRNPQGGAGMPGALSDSDRQFLVAMTASLGKTPEANRMIIDSRKKLAQRDIEVAKMAREYRAKNGRLDEGFYADLEKFSGANPLFPKQEVKGTIGAAEGQRGKSKSGRPIIMRNGQWEYE